MGHTAGELTKSLHLLRLIELRLQRLTVRYVPAHHLKGRSAVFHEWRGTDLDVREGAIEADDFPFTERHGLSRFQVTDSLRYLGLIVRMDEYQKRFAQHQ